MSIVCMDILKHLLQDHEEKFRKELALWLILIDDLFTLWTGSESEFNQFIKLCNDYLSRKGCK